MESNAICDPVAVLADATGIENPDIVREIIRNETGKTAAEPRPLSDGEKAKLADLLAEPAAGEVAPAVVAPATAAPASMTKGVVVTVSPGFGGSVADLSRPPLRQKG